jgi:glycosyltransferase involved in cell wall biosynthesis
MEKKFRILYLTTTSQLYGAEKMVYELAKRINKDRFEPMVCTIKDDLDNQLLSQLRKEGVKTACLKIEKKWEVWKTIHFFSIIKSFKPDILQSFLFFDNILARIFGKFMSIPVIISGQRNVEIHRSQLRNFIDRVTLPLADYIVSNSKAGKQILVNREKIDEKKIEVIYNGIDIQDFNKKQKADLADLFTSESFFSNKFIVGFIGSLTQQKGLNVLFEAAAELKEKSLNIILVLIGEGKRKQELEQLTKELGIEDIVYFTGYRDMGWKFMRLFDVLVSPSLWEGMPNVVIEAMAQGIIVVATNVGGIPELIEEGKDGFLVESKNIHALVDKISYIFNLPEEKRIEIRENAQKKIIKNYSIEKMVREYESLYQDLLQNR